MLQNMWFNKNTFLSAYYIDIFYQHPLILFLLKIITLVNYPFKVCSDYVIIQLWLACEKVSFHKQIFFVRLYSILIGRGLQKKEGVGSQWDTLGGYVQVPRSFFFTTPVILLLCWTEQTWFVHWNH